MKNLVIATVMVIMLGSCAHAGSNATTRVTRFDLTAITAADNRTTIPGADVILLAAAGESQPKGKTDRFGVIMIELLAEWRAILICHPLFSCGALRPADVEGFETRTVALAPVVLR